MKKKKAESKGACDVAQPSGVAKKQGASSQAKQNRNFMDDLFATKKPALETTQGLDSEMQTEMTRIEAEIKAARAKAKNDTAGPRNKPVKGSKDDLFGTANAARKKTEEGYSVYSEEELKLNKGGGDTPLCPFDCECCY